jgi:hypothetical protein
MPKRICYVHIGPPKTGTSAIQRFLKENRANLLKHGYLVPESGQAVGGAHFALVHQLCGEEVHPRQQFSVKTFVSELAESNSEAVVISAEALTGILTYPTLAQKFFASLASLDLEPRIVMFPRNQPQWLNSSYAQTIKSFRGRPLLEGFLTRAQFGRNAWTSRSEMAAANGAKVIARPYTSVSARNIVPDFLDAIGINDPALATSKTERVNESVGPFTIAVAQGVRATIEGTIKLRQAGRCKMQMEKYLSKEGLTDSGYCGLTTMLARQVEAECLASNNAFAMRVWGRTWNEMFAPDVGVEFTANDYSIAGIPEAMAPKLRRAITILAKRATIIMSRPKFASEAAWNDLRRFSHYKRSAAE